MNQFAACIAIAVQWIGIVLFRSIDVREVLPGEVTITREELRAFFHERTTFYKATVENILIDLFGPLPEGTEVD